MSDTDLKLMHRIDRLHREVPFAGSRMLQGLPGQESCKVRRLHVATLMKRMRIGMGGKGAWRDTVFVGRLWRTVRYEQVYLRASLRAHANAPEARAGIGRDLGFDNSRRPH